MTISDKMREALEFYSDPTNWISGDVPGHVYAIEDAGGIAREALKDQPKMEPVGWWDGGSRFTRHETLPQKHNWDIVYPLYIVPPPALHSVEAEKEPAGLAEQMPGAPGFTMCVFNSGEVPIGTEVYTHIDSPEHKPE